MALDRAIDDVIVQRGDARGRHRHFDPLIERRDPPRVRAAAGASRDPDARRIDFRPRLQVVERANAIPRFHAGRRVPAGGPPPAAQAIRPVMFARDLAELDRVEDEADVAVPRKPDPVVLIGRLVADPHAILHPAPVPADVEDRRQRLGDRLAADRGCR